MMNFTELVQTMSGLAGIAMILIGSDWLKKYLKYQLL